MRFLIAIMSCVFDGFWSVCYTKATTLNKAGPWVNTIFGSFLVGTIGVVSIITGWTRAPWSTFTFGLLGLFLVHMSIFFILAPIEQKALKIEKLSALQPYGNVSRVIAILSGFLILGERNIVTFIVAIFAFVCTMIYASGGKFRRFSNGITLFLCAQFLRGLRLSILALFLTENALNPIQLTGLEMATYQSMFIVLLLCSFLIASRQGGKIFSNSSSYYKYRLSGSCIGDIGWIIGLFLMAELGIITSSILSLITMATTLIMGFFLLHDTPKKKDILFATFIVVLICIGYVFRGVTI